MNFYPFDGKNSFERTEIYDYGQRIRQNDKKCISAVSENQKYNQRLLRGGDVRKHLCERIGVV